MGVKELAIGAVLVGIFTISLLTFGAQLAINNNSTSILEDDTLSGFNQTIYSNLDDFNDNVDRQEDVLTNQTAIQTEGESGFGLTSIVPVTFSFISSALLTISVITQSLAEIIGIPAIVVDVLLGGILLVMLLLAWRVWKAGGT